MTDAAMTAIYWVIDFVFVNNNPLVVIGIVTFVSLLLYKWYLHRTISPEEARRIREKMAAIAEERRIAYRNPHWRPENKKGDGP